MTHELLMDSLKELEEDYSIPKNLRSKVQTMITNLTTSQDPLLMTRVLDDLVMISDDSNLPGFVRMKVLNIMSMLETVPY